MNKGKNGQCVRCLGYANRIQESQKRAGASTRRDQTYSKCTTCHRPIHGSNRSEVRMSLVCSSCSILIQSNSTGIVQSSTGSNYVVRILSTLDREKLKPSSSVALHRHSNSLVDILPPEADSSIAMLGAHEKPDVTYADVGGLDMQKQEIREAVELPLTHFDLYKQIGKLLETFVSCSIVDKTRY
jgi:ATP-dependent 26S proteasome regulatory subunit